MALISRLALREGADPFGETITLDLSDCGFFGPSAVVTLTALRRWARDLGHDLTITAIPRKDQLSHYGRYSGLWEEFGVGPPPSSHPENVTTPVRSFQSIIPIGAIEEVVRLARSQMTLSTAAEHDVTLVLSELAQNVLDHSASPVGGFISARAYGGEREVRLAVADLGIGIRASLSSRVTTENDGLAIRLALQEEITGKTSPRNLGLGLSHLHAIVRLTEGRMVIWSQRGFLEFETGRDYVRTTDTPYPGTLVFVRLPARVAGEPGDDTTDVWT